MTTKLVKALNFLQLGKLDTKVLPEKDDASKNPEFEEVLAEE